MLRSFKFEGLEDRKLMTADIGISVPVVQVDQCEVRRVDEVAIELTSLPGSGGTEDVPTEEVTFGYTRIDSNGNVW